MRQFFLLSVSVLMLLFVSGIWTSAATSQEKNRAVLDDAGKRAIGLVVQSAERQSLPQIVSTPGKIEAVPSLQYEQHSAASGKITKVLVKLGDLVASGQILAMIDSPDLNRLAGEALQSKAQLNADVVQSKVLFENEIKEAKAKLDYAQSNYDRDKKLFDHGIASQEELQLALSDLQVAQARNTAALEKKDATIKALREKMTVTMQPLKQRLELLGVSKSDVEAMLNQRKAVVSVPVRAASNGIITEVKASAGQSVDSAAPLFFITDIRRVWATAFVYQQDVSDIHIGQPVRIKVPSFQDQTFSGALTFIGNQVDPQSHTLPVRAEIANRGMELKPDMFATLEIETGKSAAGVFVPREAIVEHNGESLVFVEEGSGYRPVTVEIGRSFADSVQVTKGVMPGQRIVVHGTFPLLAQWLKVQSGDAAFSNATEETESSKPGVQTVGQPLAPIVIIVIALVSFVAGGILTALVTMRRSGIKSNPDKTV